MKWLLQWVAVLALSALLAACRGQGTVGGVDGTVASDKPSVEMVYYDYGEPPEIYTYKAQQAVLDKYGLKHQGFGCVVTDSLLDFITRHNDSVTARLAAQYPGLTEARINVEIDAYATTQRAIETTIAPYLKKKIRHCVDSPYYSPDVVWRALDTPAKTYYVEVYLKEDVHGTREGPVMALKVIPSTGDYLVKGSDGAWNECTK